MIPYDLHFIRFMLPFDMFYLLEAPASYHYDSNVLALCSQIIDAPFAQSIVFS